MQSRFLESFGLQNFAWKEPEISILKVFGVFENVFYLVSIKMKVMV